MKQGARTISITSKATTHGRNSAIQVPNDTPLPAPDDIYNGTRDFAESMEYVTGNDTLYETDNDRENIINQDREAAHSEMYGGRGGRKFTESEYDDNHQIVFRPSYPENQFGLDKFKSIVRYALDISPEDVNEMGNKDEDNQNIYDRDNAPDLRNDDSTSDEHDNDFRD